MGGRWRTLNLLLLPAIAIVTVACDAALTTAPPLESQTLSVTQVIPVDTATNGSDDAEPDTTIVPGETHDCPQDGTDDPGIDPDGGQPGDGEAETPPCSGWVIQ